jgi:hypothetical protein
MHITPPPPPPPGKERRKEAADPPLVPRVPLCLPHLHLHLFCVCVGGGPLFLGGLGLGLGTPLLRTTYYYIPRNKQHISKQGPRSTRLCDFALLAAPRSRSRIIHTMHTTHNAQVPHNALRTAGSPLVLCVWWSFLFCGGHIYGGRRQCRMCIGPPLIARCAM